MSERTITLNGQFTETDLKHWKNWELRREIAALAGLDTTRYDTGPGPDRPRIRKKHLYQIAEALGTPPEDMTLRELYAWIGDQIGMEYAGTAGNQWGLRREHLKAIFRKLSEEVGDE